MNTFTFEFNSNPMFGPGPFQIGQEVGIYHITAIDASAGYELDGKAWVTTDWLMQYLARPRIDLNGVEDGQFREVA